MHAKWGSVAVLLLTACNSSGGNVSNGAAGNQATPPAAAANLSQPIEPLAAEEPRDLAGAWALAESIYQPYTRGEAPRTGRLYTPELAQAITRQSDADNGLGYDPFCRCQDFQNFRYRFGTIAPIAGGATVPVSFENMGERHVVELVLHRRGTEWKVHDIREGTNSLLAGGQAPQR